MNLIQLKNKLNEVMSNIGLVNTRMFGSIYENLNTNELKYSVMNIDFESVNINENNLMYNMIVYYADRLTEGNDNIYEVQTDAITAINMLVEAIAMELTVTYPTVINLFEQQFADKCGGGWARVIITVPNDLDRCTVYE